MKRRRFYEETSENSIKALEIIENNSDAVDILEQLHDEFVPDSGIADTVGGEIVRAINRIVYRWNNDGDEIGWDYGIETVNSSYEYLLEVGALAEDKFEDLDLSGHYDYDLRIYSDFLKDIMKDIIEHLHDNPELFDKENTEDSRSSFTYSEENRYEEEEEDEDDYWDSYDDYDDEEEEEEDLEESLFGNKEKKYQNTMKSLIAQTEELKKQRDAETDANKRTALVTKINDLIAQQQALRKNHWGF